MSYPTSNQVNNPYPVASKFAPIKPDVLVPVASSEADRLSAIRDLISDQPSNSGAAPLSSIRGLISDLPSNSEADRLSAIRDLISDQPSNSGADRLSSIRGLIPDQPSNNDVLSWVNLENMAVPPLNAERIMNNHERIEVVPRFVKKDNETVALEALKVFAKKVILPCTLNRAMRVERLWLRVFAVLGALPLDILTFPIRAFVLGIRRFTPFPGGGDFFSVDRENPSSHGNAPFSGWGGAPVLTVCNIKNQKEWKKDLDASESEKLKDLLVSAKTIGIFGATLRPVRTNTLKNFAKDFFLPTTVNRALHIQRLSVRVFAILGALALDIMTFPARVVTFIPAILMHRKPEDHRFYQYLKEQKVDPDLLTDDRVSVKGLGDKRMINFINYPG